jgi:hypothetical protein
MIHDFRKEISQLLKSEDQLLGLGAAQLLWPPDLVDKAVDIASNPEMIRKTQVCDNVAYYTVRGSRSSDEYTVVPNKYCSCYYYNENVFNKRTAWTCKHEIAVHLRLLLNSI